MGAPIEGKQRLKIGDSSFPTIVALLRGTLWGQPHQTLKVSNSGFGLFKVRVSPWAYAADPFGYVGALAGRLSQFDPRPF